jgi:hypothetical protein
MPYLNIVFHNIQHGGRAVNQPTSRQDYTVNFVNNANVYQINGVRGTLAAPVFGSSPTGAWGACVTRSLATPNTASGIFFCESNGYNHADYDDWRAVAPSAAVPGGVPSAIPPLPAGPVGYGYSPFRSTNTRCVFLEGKAHDPAVGAVAAIPIPPNWVGSANQALRCMGTGSATFLGPNAPWGSDRYGIVFKAFNRAYFNPVPVPVPVPITGVFVHTKNTEADPGTQIAALCRHFPTEIIFGDLNLNLRKLSNYQSLAYAVGATHTILAIQNAAGQYYCTRYQGQRGTACLDFALIPNGQVANVELWAYDPGGAAPSLLKNHSDHSVMMLRIRCT